MEEKKPPVILTYKQLAQNFVKGTGKTAQGESIRKVVRRMNKDKKQIIVVNKPGSTIKTPEGTYYISKKGKSIRMGD